MKWTQGLTRCYQDSASEAHVADSKVSLDPYRRESLKILAIFKDMVPRGEIGAIYSCMI